MWSPNKDTWSRWPPTGQEKKGSDPGAVIGSSPLSETAESIQGELLPGMCRSPVDNSTDALISSVHGLALIEQRCIAMQAFHRLKPVRLHVD